MTHGRLKPAGMKTKKDTSPITTFFKPRVDKPKNAKGLSVLALKLTPITHYFAAQLKSKVERRPQKENSSTSEFLADNPIKKSTPTKKPLQLHKPKRLVSKPSIDIFCRRPLKQPGTVSNQSFSSIPNFFDVNSPPGVSPSEGMLVVKRESKTHCKQEPTDALPPASYLCANTIVISDSPPQLDPVVDLTVDFISPPKRPCLIDLTDSQALHVPVAFKDEDAEKSSPPVAAAAASSVQSRPSLPKEPLPAKTPGPIVNELASCSDLTVSKTLEALSLHTPTKPQQGCIEPPNVPMASPHNESTKAEVTGLSCPLISSSVILPSNQVPTASTKSELELLLWQRGVPYTQQPEERQSRVLLFTKTQNCIAENLAESSPHTSSRKLCALVAYLFRSTSSLTMPCSSNLQSLWEMVMDTHTVSNHVSWESLMELSGYLRTLLSIHPPGQNPVVDQQYATFVASLGPGGPFSPWEDIYNLLRGPEYCTHLFAFIVDLLLSDYWTSLTSLDGDRRRPLFVRLFWEQPEDMHLTMPLRKLVDFTLGMVTGLNRNSEAEVSKLESCMALLFLAATRCQDLETELTIACGGLQPEQRSLFLSYIRPISLRAAIIQYTYSPLEQRLSLSMQTDAVLTPGISSHLPPPSSSDMASSLPKATGVSAALPTMCISDTDSAQDLNNSTVNNSTMISMPPQSTTVADPPATYNTAQLPTLPQTHQAIPKSRPKSAVVNAAPGPSARYFPATNGTSAKTLNVPQSRQAIPKSRPKSAVVNAAPAPTVRYFPASKGTSAKTSNVPQSRQTIPKSRPKSAVVNAAPAPTVRYFPASKGTSAKTSNMPFKRAIAMNKSTHLRYQLAGGMAPSHSARDVAGNAMQNGCEDYSSGAGIHCKSKKAWV